MTGRQPHDLVFGQYGVDAPAFDVYRDTAGQCVSCTPYSCHRDNFAGDSRLTGPEDRTMSDSYEFATHRLGCKILNTMTALGIPDGEMIG